MKEQSKAAQAAGISKCRKLAETFFWQYDPDIQAKCEMITNLIKALITAVIFAGLATAPLFTPLPIGELALGEEMASSTETVLSDGARVIQNAGKGAIKTGTKTYVFSSCFLPLSVPFGGCETCVGRACLTTHIQSLKSNADLGELISAVIKMPWTTKSEAIKVGANGKLIQPKTIGWHRVATGKTRIVANALASAPVKVSPYRHIQTRRVRY